eukprot:366895_1
MSKDSPIVITTLFVIFMIIMTLFTLPMCILCGHLLKKHWNSQFVIKRRKHLILALYIFWCWHSFLEFPLYALHGLGLLTNERGSFFDIIDTISFFIRCFSCTIYPLRLYLMYYDNEYTKVLTGKEWQILIDPTIEKTNWFLKHRRHKYGNTFFLLKSITAILSIYFIIFCTLQYTTNYNYWMLLMTSIWSLIAITIAIYYWKQYPKSFDCWNIRAEFKLIVKINLTMPVMLVLIFILVVIGAVHNIVAMFLLFVPMEAIMCGVFYALMPYIVYHAQGYISQSTDMSMMELTVQKSIRLQDLVSTDDGYQQFCSFLQREWSVENMLFVTEYVQLKQILLQKSVFREIIKERLGLEYMVNLPVSTPTSIIVKRFSEFIHNEDITDAFIQATYELYNKYMDESAALQVNICYDTRNKLSNVFRRLINKSEEPISENDSDDSIDSVMKRILPPFEVAVGEISFLMEDSYVRFKATSTFDELGKQITEQNKESI